MIYLKYLNYVLKHKWFVFLECCKVGLVWRGIIHDWSKFLPSEFGPYARYFRGKIQTGRDKTGYYNPTNTGDPDFDRAWFYHQKKNKHHWQYWCYPDAGGKTLVREIPIKYRLEMICDWKGAGRAQGTPDVTAWYEKNRDKLCLGAISRAYIEVKLGIEDCMWIKDTVFWNPKEVEGKPFAEKWWDDFYFWNHYPQMVRARLAKMPDVNEGTRCNK